MKGIELKKLRKSKGLTQKEVASKLGISERRYREWEKASTITERNSIASLSVIENYKEEPTLATNSISTPFGGTNIAQNSVKHRLREIIKISGITASSFCSAIGASSGYISGMRKSIQPEKLEKIKTLYPNWNIEWLLTGEGTPIKAPTIEEKKQKIALKGEDLIRFRKGRGLTQEQLGELLGVHRKSIQNWEKGGTIPGSKQPLLHALFSGEATATPITNNTAGVFVEPYLQENLLRIPYIEDLTACASFVENLYGYNHEVSYYPIYAERGEEITPHTHMVFQVHGESMEPTIPNHAKVLVEVVPRGKWENVKGVVLVAYRDTLTIKRVKKNNIYDKNTLTLVADNEAYGEEKIELYEIRAIWQAKRLISALL